MSFYGRVTAKPGKTLLGGVKSVLSLRKSTRQEAEDWLYAMMDQPNAGKGEVIEAKPRKRRGRRAR